MKTYKRTFYEIIEPYPSILRHKMPIFQIVMGFFYFLFAPVVYVYLLLKKGIGLFKKEERLHGKEHAPFTHHFDLGTLEEVDEKLEEGDVVSTYIQYLPIKQSMALGKELEDEYGFPISENVKGSYRIKVREEEVVTSDDEEDKVYVILDVPAIAVVIRNVLDIESHLITLFSRFFGKSKSS